MKKISTVLTSFAGVALLTMCAAAPAYAAGGESVTVGGKTLDATSVSSSFTVDVAASSGVDEVTFVLDGEYLGKDKTAPYSWNVSTSEGSHKLRTRIEYADTKTSITSEFTVGKTATTPPTAPVTPPVTPAPEPTPVPTPSTPTTPPVVTQPSNGTVVTVATAAELTTALTKATPGSTIALKDGNYEGKFVASSEGTATNPITLTGSPKAVLTTGNVKKGYGLSVTGDYWSVNGISVTNSGKGIVLDGSVGTVIDGVDVGFVGDEGVHFRTGSSDGTIVNSTVHDTGLKSPSYGEGVYIGTAKSNWDSIMGSSTTPDPSNNVTVQNNKIYNTTTEGVDVKEGTTGGRIIGNTFINSGFSGENYGDSWVDVKGNGYVISGNTGNGTLLDAFQVHQALKGWGNDNKFSNNTVEGGVPGYLVSVQSGVTGTVISCQDTSAGKGVSNIACS
jgi:hypothetical protein